MEDSLESVGFLANSANRVHVLTNLIEGPATRRELQAEVEGSRSTVARILDEAQTRGWVDSEGSRYWLTPLGESMLTDFRSYLETVAGHEHLGDMVNYLPPPVFDLDFRHLRDAEVVELSATDPSAPFTRAMELCREATEYRGLNSVALPNHAKVLRDRFSKGQLEVRHVIEADFFERIHSDPERTEVWNSWSDWVWVYDGVVPINLQIFDDTVLIWLGKTKDDPKGVLISENGAVSSWAESLIEEYRAEANPFTGF